MTVEHQTSQPWLQPYRISRSCVGAMVSYAMASVVLTSDRVATGMKNTILHVPRDLNDAQPTVGI